MAEQKPVADRDLKKEASSWLNKLEQAQKRQSDWEDDARDAEHAYSAGMTMTGDDKGGATGKVYDFNIVHSNVETIVPAIYNSTAVPDIRPRWGGDAEDPNVKAAKDLGAAMERAISVLVDDNRMDKEIESGARDAYLSGRDIVRIRFDADEQEMPAQQPIVDEYGEMVEAEPETIMANERITFEAVSWRDYRQGPARRWEDVPWIAFAHRLSGESIEDFEDPEYINAQRGGDAITGANDGDDDVTIWEVWCKASRKVKWIKEDGSEIIREDDDPLGLPGFFPAPEPVQPIGLTGQMTPVCPAKIYKKLADEVDNLTKRIERIISGLKVRGIIIGDATDILELSQLGDWELAPASSSLEALAHTGKLEDAIAWWPIDKAIAALQVLYEAREQSKQSIYEITGISDIVRGASSASETATAQQIKTQWGSLRVQRMQKLIERQVRDIFVMMVDVMARHFRPERIQELSGTQLGPEALALLQQPVNAHYRIDVESDSTIRADLTRAKGEMTEFLNGTGQFFGTMAPVIEQAPEIAGPVTEIYGSFARVFRLGKQAEDAIDQMAALAKQTAQQPRPNPEAEKMQAEMQAKQMDMQLRAQEAQQKAASEAAKLGLEREKAEADVALKQADLPIKQAELQIKQAELQLKEAELQLRAHDAEADREMRRQEAQASREAKTTEAA